MSYLPPMLHLLIAPHTLNFKHCGFLPVRDSLGPLRWVYELPQTASGGSVAMDAFRGQQFQMGKYNVIIQSCTALCGRELWRCLSPPHSLHEGHTHSQVRIFGAASRRGLIVPKDGDATTSLGQVLLPHSHGQSGFHLSHQRCLLALDLSPGTSEKGSAFPVYLLGSGKCICGPAGRLSGLKKPSSLSLPLYAMQSIQLGGCCQAAACHHFSRTGEPDWTQCSMYSLSSAQWWGTHLWG